MSTTNLLVELIIIGISALAWITFILFSLIDKQYLKLPSELSLFSLLPILTAAYILGIVMNYISDKLFSKLSKRKRDGFFENQKDYITISRHSSKREGVVHQQHF